MSRRAGRTAFPVVTRVGGWIAARRGSGRGDVLNLGQGVVHWAPPREAVEAMRAEVEMGAFPYGPTLGRRELADAIMRKLMRRGSGFAGSEHGVSPTTHQVMVTAGANQAYMNAVVALTDEADVGVLFAPFYFNHEMAHSLASVQCDVLPCQPDTWQPDLHALRMRLAADTARERRVKMVTLCNPCNPTGAVYPRELLEEARDLTAKAGAFLVVDNTYEDFVFAPAATNAATTTTTTTVWGPNVVNVFSFSKSFGMMGLRLGYVVYPLELADAFLKVQDTVVIAPTGLAQAAGLACLEKVEETWVRDRVVGLEENRRVLLDAIARSGMDLKRDGTGGSVFFMARLPSSSLQSSGRDDDEALVERLIADFGVGAIPGSACGAPGYLRLCFANIGDVELVKEAGERLVRGLRAAVAHV